MSHKPQSHKQLARAKALQRREFWASEVSLTVLLISLVLVTFVLHPLLEAEGFGLLVIDVGMTLVLIFGSGALLTHPRLARWVLGLAVVVFLSQWSTHLNDAPFLLLVNRASTLVFLSLVVGGLAQRVYRKGPVSSHRIQGAVAIYLLLGFVWAFGYSLLILADPKAITVADPSGQQVMGDLVHFSFVTLTTLGYGDILPTSPMARSLAALEALVGQLFLAVVVARLVALQITDGEEDEESP